MNQDLERTHGISAIAVICGSSVGAGAEYADSARSLGIAIAENRLDLICGGGATGMMSALIEGAVNSGGRVIGVVPKEVANQEVPHEALSEIRWVSAISDRHEAFVRDAGAVIALPGGLGTVDELFSVLARARMGLHSRPCGILNTRGYFDHLLHFMRHATDQGFIKSRHLSLFYLARDPLELISILLQGRRVSR